MHNAHNGGGGEWQRRYNNNSERHVKKAVCEHMGTTEDNTQNVFLIAGAGTGRFLLVGAVMVPARKSYAAWAAVASAIALCKGSRAGIGST